MADHQERFNLARDNFAKAFTRLQEVLAVAEDDIVRDSLIQRFEFTYELGLKAMFYWLRDQGERVPETGRMVLQAAFKAELIEDADLWERIKDFRNETSHTYDAEKAKLVATFVRNEAAGAFEKLRDKLKSL